MYDAELSAELSGPVLAIEAPKSEKKKEDDKGVKSKQQPSSK